MKRPEDDKEFMEVVGHFDFTPTFSKIGWDCTAPSFDTFRTLG